MAVKPLFPLEAFHAQPGITHVCAAGESLSLLASTAAFSKYVRDKSGGSRGRGMVTKEIDDVRGLVARAWNVQQEEIGFVSNVAEGVSLLLESLDWQDQDNVVFHPNEFSSVAAPFELQAQRRQKQSISAFKIRYAGAATVGDVADSNTRLIAVSYVSYVDGARVDLSHYRRVADSVGAILLVDYSQAAGYTPIEASVADFAFSACFKFLLGTTGAAIAYWNRARQPSWQPASAGSYSLALGSARPDWPGSSVDIVKDARSFTRGNPSHPSIYVLGEALRFILRWDATAIEAHVQSLTMELLQRLGREGIPTSTPKQKEAHGSSVMVDCRGAT